MEKRKKSKSLKLRVNPEVKETVKDVAKTVVKTAAVTLTTVLIHNKFGKNGRK